MPSLARQSIAHKRVPRTVVCAGWNGTGTVSANCLDNAGLSQHHIAIATTGSFSAASLVVMVRPYGTFYFVPIETLDLAGSTLRNVRFAGLVDGVQLSFSAPPTGTIQVFASICSVGSSFNSASNPMDETIARRRPLAVTLARAWDGATPVSISNGDVAVLGQHQVSISGGSGTVALMGRPVGFPVFTHVSTRCDALNAAGDIALFTGFYDGFMLAPSGSVHGTIASDTVSVAQELLLDLPQ